MVLEVFRKFFKKFDYFGVQFNFHYKSKEKFYSATGGFIFIGFILVTITYILVNSFSFFGRKNYSIIYYNLQMSEAEEISLNNYSSTLGSGVECEQSDVTT